MKVLTIVGARPQFVKAAALSRELAKHDGIEEVIVHTGQHFDPNMSDVFFEEMEIPRPAYNMDIHSLGHGAMTGRMMEGIERILLGEQPDVLLVYGDTNSTIAGALAARKLHIPVCHVEAGLRSFDMNMPEEVNRILTDRISDVLYCPTDVAIENLIGEGYDHFDCEVVKVGDVMQDAALYYAEHSSEKSSLEIAGDFVLCTLHRAENTDDVERLSAIIKALEEIHGRSKVVLPLHPRTKKKLEEYGMHPKLEVINPVGYFDMIELLKRCSLVMTDSGGLQKEAYFFSKHCIILRDQTEWVELVKNGFNEVVGADYDQIIWAYESLSERLSDFSQELYGGGKACKNIATHMLKKYGTV
jgi:UDP-GlcNAc3NAcA epimerase